MSGNGAAYYEELAENSRNLRKMLEDNCKHEWTPLTCDEQGVTKSIQCCRCGKYSEVVIKPD